MAFEDRSLPTWDNPPLPPVCLPASRRQKVLFSIGVASAVATLAIGALNPAGPPANPSIIVECRLDPNVAAAWELDRIPGVGSGVARRIIDARRLPPGSPTAAARFLAPRDLLNIHGVGPAMMEALQPYLRFPDYQPAPR